MIPLRKLVVVHSLQVKRNHGLNRLLWQIFPRNYIKVRRGVKMPLLNPFTTAANQ